MYRQKLLLSLIVIVCLLSIFFVVPTSYAHPDHGDIQKAKQNLENSIKYMNRVVGNYDQIRGAMETLIGEYESNEAAIKKANDAALTKASIALVANENLQETASLLMQ